MPRARRQPLWGAGALRGCCQNPTWAPGTWHRTVTTETEAGPCSLPLPFHPGLSPTAASWVRGEGQGSFSALLSCSKARPGVASWPGLERGTGGHCPPWKVSALGGLGLQSPVAEATGEG